jgi:hypothetical protein
MSLLLRLLLGHMIGDYVLQPYQLVLVKRRGWPGVLLHVAIVVAVTALLLWPVLFHWWYWLWLLFVAISHLAFDASRSLHWSKSQEHGLLYLAMDQALHVAVLSAVAGLTSVAQIRHPGLPVLTANAQGDALALYAIVLVFLIWTVPVLELETVNTLEGGERRTQIAARDRWLGALERVAGLALMLSGFFYLAPLTFLPRIALQREEWAGSPRRLGFFAKPAISFFSVVLCGVILSLAPSPLA